MDQKSPLRTVDDLIRQRARDSAQKPLVAFPVSDHGLTDFELFTGQDLDRFADAAAKALLGRDLQPAVQYPAPVIVLLGLSRLDYMITMFGLTRLGYAVLILSPRLPVESSVHLLRAADASIIVYDHALEPVVQSIKQEANVVSIPMLPRAEYDIPNDMSDPFRLEIDEKLASNRKSFIMHSSGSTGLPKLIYQTHQSSLETFAFGWGARAFTTAPIFHTYGHSTLFRSIYTSGTIYMYNADVPLTSRGLAAVLEEVKPEVFFAVPYVLKLVAESKRGLAALRACATVSTSGSACPDDLGDLLTESGVHYVTALGLTETGLLMTSKRPRGDETWDYMRILPSVRPYIMMKPVYGNVCELIVLDGLKSKNTSNSDDPPNSFHTRDTFAPHPTIPDAWKFIGRLDDRVTLANGEKVLPVPIEGRIRQDALVRETVVFGIGRDIPGLLVFRSEIARSLSDEDYISAIWPVIAEANSHAEGFSQISRDMIVPISADRPYPQTDKGTIIRAQVYAVFAEQINQAYERLLQHGLSSAGRRQRELLRLGESELREFLHEVVRAELGIRLDDSDSEFFASGLDSLKAIQLVGLIKKQLYLESNPERVKLDQNTVYEKRNVNGLAEYIYALQTGRDWDDDDADGELEMMTTLIERYSSFPKRTISLSRVEEALKDTLSGDWCVLLTGVTGSLGAHLLTQLLRHDNVRKVFCLVRSSSGQTPIQRIFSSLRDRCLEIPEDVLASRVVGISSDFQDPQLGCPSDVIETLRNSPCLIIHAAWEVNFNLPLASFEAEAIAGTKHLLDLSLSVGTSPGQQQPGRFVFISSISTAMGSPPRTTVSESQIENLAHAQTTGYARSKLVAEHIAHNAAVTAGADVRVLRIGQIVGDSRNGVWNDDEAIPLMIRSAKTVGALPQLQEKCSWLPVDQCAAAILELSGLSSGLVSKPSLPASLLYYNVLHPIPFDWTDDLLPALRRAGMQFNAIPPREWVRLLEQCHDADPKTDPSIKLLGFWQDRYERRNELSHTAQIVKFSTTIAERDSVSLREAQDCISSGLVERFVQRWMRVWSA